MLDNFFELDNNSEQINTFDNNINQSFYLDTKNLLLPSRRNNLPHFLDDIANIVEFDLMQ